MSGFFRPGRHLPLLLALVGLFAAYPLMVSVDRLALFRWVFGGVLVVAAYTVGGQRRDLWFALALSLTAALSHVFAHLRPEGLAPLVSVALSLVLLIFITRIVLFAVIRPGRVTTDRIAGAISAYLLLGLIWSLLYGVVAMLDPSAFRMPSGAGYGPGTPGGEYAFMYYSFVTLTTLGYGDISPATAWSQTLAWMEAVVGQLYLAILVARMVSLHLMHGSDPASDQASDPASDPGL